MKETTASRQSITDSEGPTPARLRLHLLGPTSATWAGRRMPISRRQVRALLYRLAASLDPLPREHLSFLFWPDVPELAARRKLSGLLAHLRRDLPEPHILATQEDHVGLDPRDAWSDFLAFQRLCGSQTSAADPESLRQAVELYRGPFLQGFSLPDAPEYESWITAERESCERAYLEALTVLIELKASSGDYEEALAYSQSYLENDDLSEEIHRRAIELFTALGDRGAALRQYERCAVILRDELGVEPLPETQEALKAALATRGPQRGKALAHRPSLAPQRGAEQKPTAQLPWTTHPGLGLEFVGRSEAIQQLAEAFSRAQEGQGRIILISGEPGIGKSRLMQEFAISLGADSLVLAGSGHRDTEASPYQPIIEALRPALLDRHDWLDVPEWCHAQACRLIPELHRFHPESTGMVIGGPEQARAVLFEALFQLLIGLAAGPQPVLLCLDDLHWCGATTLDWLAYVARQLAQAQNPRLLILGTYSSEEAPALLSLRRGLAREGVLEEMVLGGLNQAEILQLLQPFSSLIPCDQDLVRSLDKASAGNPFFILETLRVLADVGCEGREQAGSNSPLLPASVQAAVEERVARLSPRAQQVLEAGAVLGRSFNFDLVRQTSGRGDMEAVDGLDEVVARGLLEEGATGYWFRHEIIRSAVYRGLGRQRREILHQRAGQALERLEPSDPASLARHFELAGQPGRAAPYAIQAGHAAKAVFAGAEALAHFGKALELLEWAALDLQDPEAVAANEKLRVEALFGRGWALRLVGDMETYAQEGKEVARLARSLGDARAVAQMHWRDAYTHRWFCRYGEARSSALEGLRQSLDLQDLLLEALCRREVGLAARATGDYELARQELEQALRLFAGLGDAVFQIHTLGNLATLSWYESDYKQSMELSRQALELCKPAGMHLERRLPLGDMGAAAVAMDAVDLAWECLEESLSISRQVADRTQEILCLNHLGWLNLRLKQPLMARDYLQTGLELARKVGSCTEQAWLVAGLSEASHQAGDPAEALAYAREAQTLAQRTGAAYDERLVSWVLSRLGL